MRAAAAKAASTTTGQDDPDQRSGQVFQKLVRHNLLANGGDHPAAEGLARRDLFGPPDAQGADQLTKLAAAEDQVRGRGDWQAAFEAQQKLGALTGGSAAFADPERSYPLSLAPFEKPLGRSFEELQFLAVQHAGEFGPTVLNIIDSNADQARAVNRDAGRFPTDLANGASSRFAVRAYESALVWSMLTGDPQYLNRAIEKLGALASDKLGGIGAYESITAQVLGNLQAQPGKSMSLADVEGTLRQADVADDGLPHVSPYPTHLPYDATPEELERKAQTDPQAFRQNTLAEIDRAGQAALLSFHTPGRHSVQQDQQTASETLRAFSLAVTASMLTGDGSYLTQARKALARLEGVKFDGAGDYKQVIADVARDLADNPGKRSSLKDIRETLALMELSMSEALPDPAEAKAKYALLGALTLAGGGAYGKATIERPSAKIGESSAANQPIQLTKYDLGELAFQGGEKDIYELPGTPNKLVSVFQKEGIFSDSDAYQRYEYEIGLSCRKE